MINLEFNYVTVGANEKYFDFYQNKENSASPKIPDGNWGPPILLFKRYGRRFPGGVKRPEVEV
jgi:hypothetical protein